MNPELTILRFSPEFKEDPQTNKNTRMVYFSGDSVKAEYLCFIFGGRHAHI